MDINNGIEQEYNELAIRRNAAFATFSSIYVNEHPQPVLGTVQTEKNGTFVMLTIIVLASMIVSGSRTIQIFGGMEKLPIMAILVGLAAFLMSEVGLVFLAFHRTRTGFNAQRQHTTRRQAALGLGMIFTVAISANVQSVLELHGTVIDPNIATLINLAVAISAPVIAFICGDILAYERMRLNDKERRVLEMYTHAMDEWQAAMQAAWEAQMTRYGGNIKVSRPVPQNVPSVPQNVPRGTPKELLSQYLSQNPEGWDMSIRELSQIVGLPKSTVGRLIKELRP